MLDQFKPEGTEKIRYRIPEDSGLVWEVDEFLAENQGLIVAELELSSEDQSFSSPEWLDEEVTYDERYSNANLALMPFGTINKK